jgi:hypothetical protein
MRRRVTAGRARGALLSGLAAFLLGEAALSAFVETRWQAVRDPVHFTRLRHLRRKLAAAPSPPRTILFLGTSRFELGVQTGLLERRLSAELGRPVVAANWGTGGWGLVRPLLAWDRLRRAGVRPDLVLVEVLPVLLSANHHLDTVEPPLPGSELDAEDLRVVGRHEPGRDRLRRERLEALLVPVYGHRHNLLRLYRPSLVQAWGRQVEHLAFDARATWPAEVRAAGLARTAHGYGTQFGKFLLSGERVAAVEDLLGSLREAGVPAALVLMPEGPWFRSLCPPGVWAQVERCLAELSARQGTPLLNLREWIEDEGEFNDSHHLTAEGADRFSARLARDALAPLLRRLDAGEPLARRGQGP